MTDDEKQKEGEARLWALQEAHGDDAMLQMVMGLTSGMLQFIGPTELRAVKLRQFVGAMTSEEWELGVKLTVQVLNAEKSDA